MPIEQYDKNIAFSPRCAFLKMHSLESDATYIVSPLQKPFNSSHLKATAEEKQLHFEV